MACLILIYTFSVYIDILRLGLIWSLKKIASLVSLTLLAPLGSGGSGTFCFLFSYIFLVLAFFPRVSAHLGTSPNLNFSRRYLTITYCRLRSPSHFYAIPPSGYCLLSFLSLL
jgi:hypothetical protein